MIRSILVALDTGENMSFVLKYGLELAQYFDAQLHGIHVLDARKLYSPFIEDVLYSAGLVSMPNLQDLVKERMTKVSQILHSSWQNGTAEYDLEGKFYSHEGIVSEELAKEARKHDLLVVGTRGENFQLSQLLVGSSFNEVVQLVNRPILVVPDQVKKFYSGSKKKYSDIDGAAGAAAGASAAVFFIPGWPGPRGPRRPPPE